MPILEDEDNADKLDDIVEGFAKELEEFLADCAGVKACAKPFSSSDPDPSPAIEAAPDPSPAIEVTPDPTSATEATLDPSPATKATPGPTSATEVTPDSTQVMEAVPDPSPETVEAVPGPSIATEHEHGDAATTEETESKAKESPLEIVVMPTGKKPNKPPGWRDSLLAQLITICQKKSISYLTKLEGCHLGKDRQKIEEGSQGSRYSWCHWWSLWCCRGNWDWSYWRRGYWWHSDCTDWWSWCCTDRCRGSCCGGTFGITVRGWWCWCSRASYWRPCYCSQ